MQHAVQRNILQRVIQYSQKMQQLLYLTRRKVSGSGSHMHRNAFLLQHPLENLIPARCSTQQNDNIPITHPSECTAFLICNLKFPHQLSDLRRYTICLLFLNRDLLAFVGARTDIRCLLPSLTGRKKKQFSRIWISSFCYCILSLRRIHGARMQGSQIVIDDSTHILPHDLCKNRIDGIQHLHPAPEILMKVYPTCRNLLHTRLPL